MSRKTQALAALCAGVMIAATGCGGSGDSGGGDSTITWWHNSNNEPGKGFYEQVAKDFEKANPGVDVKVEAFAHEDMLTKLDAAFQSGDVPDVYMERGGGELADHVEAGLTRDLSKDSADIIEQIGGSAAGWQVDGKTYALPFSMGVVGFWYNTELFEKAGITETPTTMPELYAAFDKLEKAGITPVSLGGGDLWPAAHYYYAAALRGCSQETLTSAVADLDFSDPCFEKAGETVEQIVAERPFNKGFLSTASQTGPTSASGLLATGKVAMELAGHWEPGVMQGITEDKQGLGDKTGWFPFPAVDGGEGDPTAQLGGGDAWAVSEEAPDKAVDLVNYLLSDDVQKGFAENDMGLPTVPAAGSSVKDPALAELLKVRDEAPFVQLYFDTAFGESVGGAMNDEIGLLFAGKATPEDVVTATQEAADKEK
ncbi:carbohydrate ABC transporter substrate-binding protein (CUT1 family) [Nocardioides albertanoniae]|uniref:Carbohydrate ABC transporter substrate-binding protein (CUT1 family) n=1 Tax=Nocardioides albertanoniae TaxID=1175486 RepID=A0A543A6R8_9ACTN|nr:extracellular solute-binding protein [Nocardioides albertanoniae]TQL68267.1 carbohydrate ABC transporter substrate-binding protein (CUT1 family) [Nocardioides albertanoniae]